MVNLERIKLVNFIGIYLGTGLKEIEIDRKNSSNNIIIILGENGSGKSSLINELTPLPLEHLGPRNSSRIIPGETGIKELDLRVDGVVLYKIKIVYSPTKPTKCYILKEIDGKEIDLNPNGNVESYLEVLEHELHMNKNYTNVGFLCGNGKNKNFVGMKPTERNNYISEWMPEISEFLDAYKLSTKILTKLKRDIDNYNKQIGNMSSIDYELQLNYTNASLETLNKQLKEVEKQITELKVYNSQLEKYHRDSQKLNDLKVEFLNRSFEINKKKNEFINKWSGIELPDISNIKEFNEKKQYYHDCQKDIINKLDKIEETMNILSENISTSRSMLNTDSRISGMDLNMIYNNIDSNKKILEDISGAINDICDKYKSTSEELKIDAIQISDINSIISIVDSRFIQLNNIVGMDVIKDMDNLDKSINEKTERLSLLNELNKSINDKLTLINNEIYKYEHSNLDTEILMKRPEFCINKECGIVTELLKYLNPKDNLQNYYDESRQLEKEKIENQAEIDEINTTLKNYKDSMHIYVEITDFLYKNNEKIANLPTPIRELLTKEPSSIYTHINEIKSVIQELTEFSTLSDKYTDIIKSNEDLENIKNLVFTNTQLDQKIKESVAKYDNLKIEKDNLMNEYELITKQVSVYDNATDIIENYNSELENINSEIHNCKIIKKYLSQLNEVNYYYDSNKYYIDNVLSNKETKLKSEIFELNKKRDEMTTFYVSKRQVEKMRNELQDQFNRVNILNKIWSPKVGYPAIKIDSFLSNLTIKTNEDLTNMWGANNLKIKDFKIDASDFNIVVMKDGTEIKDASLCSESETQTINTAISFSIVESNIENNGYDVLRLDELDMSLDQERRQSFIEMINNRINEMGVDSCFIISHNNRFDDIPADVILMSDYKLEDEQSKNKNIIFRAM